MSGLSLGTCTSNLLKSTVLTILELLAFNAQKFRGSLATNLSEDVAGQWFGDTICSFNKLKQINSGAVLFHRHHKELVSFKFVQYLSTKLKLKPGTRNRQVTI